MKGVELEAIDYKGLWSGVLLNLRKCIFDGQLKPGDQLVESQIAYQMHVSRGPVRDALKQLEIEGLAENIPRRGTFVRRLSKKDFKQIYELRAYLESLAIKLGIEKLEENPELLSSLKENAKNMGKAAKEGKTAQVAELDLNFHQTICESSRNQYLIDAWMRIKTLIHLCLITDLTYENYRKTDQDHSIIIDSISRRDVMDGEERIRDHIASSSTLLFGE